MGNNNTGSWYAVEFAKTYIEFENILNSSSLSSRLPKEFKTSTDDFASAPNWEYYSHTENIKTNTKYYMIFVWVNSNVDKELNELSFCIILWRQIISFCNVGRIYQHDLRCQPISSYQYRMGEMCSKSRV